VEIEPGFRQMIGLPADSIEFFFWDCGNAVCKETKVNAIKIRL
jgi:hypothetical protein